MQIVVNGEPHVSPDSVSIAGLLDTLAVTRGRVAVEVNEEVIPRDDFGSRLLHEGDRVEIVHFVGGG